MADSDGKKKTMMTWSESKDLILMREMGSQGIFAQKSGSRERGNTWQVIAGNLNTQPNFEVSGRSVRDRFNIISKKFKAKTAKELKATGLGGEVPTEYELLLEELIELSEESDNKAVEQSEAVKAKVDVEKHKAFEIRQTAMETVGESKKRLSDEGRETKESKKRRTGNDTITWLREKGKRDAELKERELESQQEEGDTQRKERNQMLEMFHRQMQQQTEQHHQQQSIMQQQMMAMIQQQQQQTQLLMKMFSDTKKN